MAAGIGYGKGVFYWVYWVGTTSDEDPTNQPIGSVKSFLLKGR